MKLLSASAVLFVSAQAAKFSAPIHAEYAQHLQVPAGEHRSNSHQHVLEGHLKGSSRWPFRSRKSQAKGLPVQNADWLLYKTHIGLGTAPAQAFRTVIDLSWTDLFVPSVKCVRCRGEGHYVYNSTGSPTYTSNGTNIELYYTGIYGKGFVSEDTLTIGDGVEVPYTQFGEMTYISTVPWAQYDGAFGFALGKPKWEQPNGGGRILSSPFATMVERGVLDHNMFSLYIPNEDETGDLTFGGYREELFEGELSTHALHPANTTDWTIQISSVSVTLENGSEAANISLSSYPGNLETGFPFIMLPKKFGEHLRLSMNLDYDECYVGTYPCDRLDELPILTFEIGGQKFTLTGRDYSEESYFPFCPSKKFCAPAVGPADDEGMGAVTLGSLFLKKYYSVYDWDNKVVRFAKAKH